MPGESLVLVEPKERSLMRKVRSFLNIAIRNQPAKRSNIFAVEARSEQHNQNAL
jgi:hypothetical protein